MRMLPRISLLVWAFALVFVSASFAAPEIKPQAAKHFSTAFQLQKSGKLDKAIEEYRSGLKIEPNNVGALTNLSIIYIQKKQLSNAEAAYMRILGIEPKNEAVQEQLVRVLVEQGKSKDALSYARKLSDSKPQDKTRKELLAAVHMNLKDYNAAAEVYRSIIRSHPKDESAYANLAACHMAAGKDNDVLAVMNELLKVNPSSPQGRMTAAHAAEKLGNNALALQHYEAASKGPAAAAALLNAARLYQVLGQPEKGVDALRRLIAVDKDNFDAHFNLGAYEYGQRNWTKAIVHWTAAKRIQPKEFNVNLNLAMALSRVGRYTEALESTTVAINLKPKDPLILEAHAYVLECIPEPDKAIQVYKRWEQYHPNDPAPNHKLGILYYGRQKKSEAYAQFDIALKKSPRSVEILSTYGEALLADGQPGKASDYYKRAVDADPRSIPTALRAASCLQQDKKPDEAIALLTRAVGMEPDNKEARMRLAMMHRDQNRPDLAIAQYRKLVELDAEDSMAALQLAQLYSETLDHAASAGVYRALLESSKADEARFMRQMLARELEMSGDYAGALEQYAELAKSTEIVAKADALVRTAGILEKQSKFDEALTTYRRAVDLYPDEATVIALGKLSESQKKVDEFHAYLKSVIRTSDKNPPYRYFAGTFRAANKASEAIEVLNAVALSNPENTQLSLLLASELALSGETVAAVERYESVIEKYPNDPTARRELGGLLVQNGQKSEGVEHLAVACGQLPNDGALLRELADLYYSLPGKRTDALNAYRTYIQKHDPANQEVKLRIRELESPDADSSEQPAAAVPALH